jgi:serine/threonine-protein kinase
MTGTPAFAAPEQLLGEPQGTAVDCFAMGGLVYFALTGRAPFGEGDPKLILARQLANSIDMQSLRQPVAQWLGRALEPDPSKRYANATEMQEGFKECLHELERDERRWWRWRHGRTP